METKKKLQRFLSIFLACVMIMNVPMSALAFEDVQILDVVEDVEPVVVEEEPASSEEGVINDGEPTNDEIFIEEVILDNSSEESGYVIESDADGLIEDMEIIDNETTSLDDAEGDISSEEMTFSKLEFALSELPEDAATEEYLAWVRNEDSSYTVTLPSDEEESISTIYVKPELTNEDCQALVKVSDENAVILNAGEWNAVEVEMDFASAAEKTIMLQIRLTEVWDSEDAVQYVVSFEKELTEVPETEDLMTEETTEAVTEITTEAVTEEMTESVTEAGGETEAESETETEFANILEETFGEDVLSLASDEESNILASGSVGATETDDVNWVLSQDGVLTISGTGAMKNFTTGSGAAPWLDYYKEITSLVVEDGVTSIGNYAFYKSTAYKVSNMTSVVLADTVTGIGNNAFQHCTGLSSIQMPSGLQSIGNNAFQTCSALKSITLPEGLQTIGNYAFSGCSELANLVLPEGLKSIGNNAFASIAIKEAVIPDSVTSIGTNLFSNNLKLESITFGSGITSIPIRACQNCSVLTSITYKGKITSIGDYAFQKCAGLKTVEIPDTCTTLGRNVFDNCIALESVTIPASVTSMGAYSYAFNGCTGLKSVVIETGALGTYAFQNCTALTGVTFGEEAALIPDYAFANCTALESVTIPETVTTINKYAFSGCSSLKNITVPSSVTAMGNYVFRNCTALESAVVETDYLGGYAFAGCTALQSLSFGEAVTAIGASALRGTSFTSITLQEGIKTIGDYAFADNAELTSVSLPSTVNSIGTSVFYNCPKLENVTILSESFKNQEGILYSADMKTLLSAVSAKAEVVTVPEGVTAIADNAFKGNSYVKVISLPDSLTSIGASAFAECTALSSISVPAGVTTLNDSVFSGCTALTSVYMNGVTKIGTGAFEGCTSLISAIGSKVTEIGANAFKGCTALTGYTIPASVITVGDSAFAGTGLKSVKIPATVESWGSKMFDGCASLASVTFDTAVTSLPESMFYNCTALTEVALPADMTTIPASLFYGCTALAKIEIPAGATSIGGSAFNGCTALAEVTLPGGLLTIGGFAFNGCTSLTSIHIPASVTSIGGSAFGGTGNLETVTFAEGIQITELGCFYGSGIKSIEVPEGVTKLGWTAFRGCKNLESVKLPSTLTYIDGQVFTDCTSLKSITIPAGVTTLSSSLFSGCSSLTRAEMYANITDIPFMTFTNCTVLSEIVLPSTITSISDSMLGLGNLKTIYFMGTEEQWNAIEISQYAQNALKNVTVIFNFDPNGVGVAPVITTQPESAEYTWAATPKPLKIEATAEEGAILTFNWYKNDTESTEGGTGVVSEDGENSSELTFNCDTVGTTYYYCVVKSIKDGVVEETISNVVTVTVTGEENKVAFEGEGTAEKPYLLNTVEDLQLVYNYVACGYHFENEYLLLTGDVALAADWKPIGILKSGATSTGTGKNVLNFRGNFDGGNHTVTIAEGGLPLFGYVYHSSISNLNIYGKQIAGAGLINKYDVDYGPGGSYNADIAICDITNVTLKSGSATLRSGLVQGNGSGINLVNFTNCTVESGVTVGYAKDSNMIGSFISCLNGTMTNCVSYADVYGESAVGGLAGTKGQSMGPSRFINCSFKGTVNAAGNYAGGIIGRGYDGSGTAPNTPCVTIKNCYVNGTITGADYVGGIMGAETGSVQCWSNGIGYVQDNLFDGVINSAGSCVGGIIGYLNSLNRYNVISNNYYYGETLRGIGFAKYIDTSCAEPSQIEGVTYFNTETTTAGAPSGVAYTEHNRTDDPLGADAKALAACADGETTVLDKLNGSETGSGNWITDENGRPILSDKIFVKDIVISGSYKTDYYVGQELDLTGMVLTAQWSDGSETELSVDEVTITGYDKNTRGEQEVSVVYGSASAVFRVMVLKKSNDIITVTFTLLGDVVHDVSKDGIAHTHKEGNLTTWIAETTYDVNLNATVKDVLEKALAENNMSCSNPEGNYVESVTNGTITLGEFDNGTNLSGWMYTLNDYYPDLGVQEQYLEDGDVIVFHFTDDYTQEHRHRWSTEWASDADAHWHSCDDWCPIEENAQKQGYAVHTASDWIIDNAATGAKHKECTVCGYVLETASEHTCTWDAGTVTQAATCTTTGVKTYKCVCGAVKTEDIPAAGHKYGSWTTKSEAMVKAAEVQKHTCSACGTSETKSVGKALTPVLEVPGKLSSFNIKKGKTVKFALTMANGDAIKSVTSNAAKYVKVSAVDKKKGQISLKAVKKGTAKITVTLASGKSRTYTVKAVTGTVKTTSLTVSNVTNKKLTLAAKKTYNLKTVVKPFTTTQKITYKSSNKKIAKVSSSGKITAVAPGKATITVTSGSKKVKITVTVPGITKVKSSVSVKKNKTLTLKPKTYGISGKVTYTSSDPKIATVSSKGKIKGIKKGTARITIKAGTFTKTVKVKVK